MRKNECLVFFIPIMGESYAALLSCMAGVQVSDSWWLRYIALSSWLGLDDCL